MRYNDVKIRTFDHNEDLIRAYLKTAQRCGIVPAADVACQESEAPPMGLLVRMAHKARIEDCGSEDAGVVFRQEYHYAGVRVLTTTEVLKKYPILLRYYSHKPSAQGYLTRLCRDGHLSYLRDASQASGHYQIYDDERLQDAVRLVDARTGKGEWLTMYALKHKFGTPHTKGRFATRIHYLCRRGVLQKKKLLGTSVYKLDAAMEREAAAMVKKRERGVDA